MVYDLWRNKLNEEFFISLNDVDYYVPANGLVNLPEEYSSVVVRRGYALEFLARQYDGSRAVQWPEPQISDELQETLAFAQDLLKSPDKTSAVRPVKAKKAKKNESN